MRSMLWSIVVLTLVCIPASVQSRRLVEEILRPTKRLERTIDAGSRADARRDPTLEIRRASIEEQEHLTDRPAQFPVIAAESIDGRGVKTGKSRVVPLAGQVTVVWPDGRVLRIREVRVSLEFSPEGREARLIVEPLPSRNPPRPDYIIIGSGVD